MSNSTRATSLFPPPNSKMYGSQSETNHYQTASDNPSPTDQILRSLSPEDIQKLKYKIDLDKQVAEKQKRLAREWEKKIEHDKKEVQHQAFGRHDRTTVLNPKELEEILTKGRAPSPVLDMPQQYPLYQQQNSAQPPVQQQGPPFAKESYMPNDNTPRNLYGSPRQPSVNTHSQHSSYSTGLPPPPPQQSAVPPLQASQSFSNSGDFQRFYGPNGVHGGLSQGLSTAQPIKGDAHDPFSSFDPNKEGQNVFNTIPQQDLYDPWGRPGAGAPLIHAPTGQKFTRYSGSLEEKLTTTGPLGFNRRQFTEDISEQKRDLEMEQRRRQNDDMEFRASITGARTRFRSEDSRMLHDDLIRQAEERNRIQKMSRYHENIAELNHSQAMNNWWGKSGGGAPTNTSRRHNVNNTFEKSRQKWTTNHLGQLIAADDEPSGNVKVQATDFYYPKSKQLSNHRNNYQLSDDQAS